MGALPPSCPPAIGFIQGSVFETATGRGTILATWADEYGSGANVFVATSGASINGFYCSGSEGVIDFCIEEFYSLGESLMNASACTAHEPLRPPPPFPPPLSCSNACLGSTCLQLSALLTCEQFASSGCECGG